MYSFKLNADIQTEVIEHITDAIVCSVTKIAYYQRGDNTMYEIVDSEEEAIKLQNRVNTIDAKEKFCPLINDNCNPECVCFLKATHRKTNYPNQKEQYIVQNGFCNNNMFHGGE